MFDGSVVSFLAPEEAIISVVLTPLLDFFYTSYSRVVVHVEG